MHLLARALTKGLLGIVCFGVLLFLPAGTFDYPNAWLLMGILFVPMFFAGIFMSIKAPALLEKRLRAKEENNEQKSVILLSALLFAAMFVLAGLDYRFGWSRPVRALPIVSAVVFLAGYALYAEVLRENAYLSRTVEVQAEQTVVDTGLYGVVRHPMYTATLLLFLSMPLVLGSFYAFLLMLASYPPLIARRIRDEERTLAEGLPGYRAYMENVKYRMIPFVW